MLFERIKRRLACGFFQSYICSVFLDYSHLCQVFVSTFFLTQVGCACAGSVVSCRDQIFCWGSIIYILLDPLPNCLFQDPAQPFLSPLYPSDPIHQLFSTALWLLDSYWQYFMFTLFMIASFEATVVMQRLKNLQTLKGMGNDVVNLKVFRAGRLALGLTFFMAAGTPTRTCCF